MLLSIYLACCADELIKLSGGSGSSYSKYEFCSIGILQCFMSLLALKNMKILFFNKTTEYAILGTFYCYLVLNMQGLAKTNNSKKEIDGNLEIVL